MVFICLAGAYMTPLKTRQHKRQVLEMGDFQLNMDTVGKTAAFWPIPNTFTRWGDGKRVETLFDQRLHTWPRQGAKEGVA